jgi:hypothetical protein
MDKIKQRRQQANYLDIGTDETSDIQFLGTGFTELNESPGAQTSSKRYIDQASVTARITGYEPEHSFNTDIIQSEAAIKHICDVAKYRKIGADAEADYFIVDLDEPATGDNTFKARLERVAIEVSSFGDDDGSMTAEGSFRAIGDVTPGTFNTSTKTFTPTATAVEEA